MSTGARYWNSLRLWHTVLALGGIGVTGFLTYEKFTAGTGLVCGPGGGCSVVLSSPYASVGPLPLTVFGLGLYGSVLVLALWSPNRLPWAGVGLWVLANLGAGFSGYLMSLLAFEIRAFCPYCLASAMLLATLWLTQLITQKECRSPRGLILGFTVISLVALGALGLHEVQKNAPPPVPADYGIRSQ
ncbi:vitamin K epoxide reductase family protein [Anthocerotibacter panamensis]|uniref:vitamin K epoxide reductase family protein n=1 Tax=Anthocerotibacter panamensis TaxID=2857077 RepID=UPI001C403B59|nr:vitamin K epoxide reductase family protein [Anthocerotibacter panamensis]